MLSVIMLSVIMLSVIMLSVIMLSVVASSYGSVYINKFMDQTGGVKRLVGFKILRRSIHKGHSHPAYHPSTLKIPSKIDPAGKSDKIYECNLQL
jgi:hypothetical protein